MVGVGNKVELLFVCAYDELQEVTQILEKLFNFVVVKERTVCKIHIPLKELSLFVKQFGNGVLNKHLTNDIFDLPRELQKGFLDGYMSADGCFTQGLHKATTVSRELVYGLAQCVAKVYRVPYKIYRTKRPSKCVIEGRVVNQHDTYQIVWKDKPYKQDKAFFENGYIWFPIKQITEVEPQNVYDLEVENNHSFTVQNAIVHNCQDLSLAGQGKGMTKGSGTRSGLLWEVERLLGEMKELPQILLMENVPQVHGKKNKQDFDNWCKSLEQLGYKNFWQDLNAKDYGIPQNRNRCFMISLLGDYNYSFPSKMELQVRLKDFLDKKVDEKYYLLDKTIEMFIEHTKKQQAKGNGFKFEPTDGNCVGKAITTRAGARPDDNFIKEQCDGVMLGTSEQFNGGLYEEMSRSITTKGKNGVIEWNKKITCNQIGMLNGGKEPKIINPLKNKTNRSWLFEQNVYDKNGLIRALKASEGSRNIPKVLETNIQNYRIRKLTERECFRLMGVKEHDFENVSKNQSISSLFHLAGDSIVTTVLMSIFGELFDIDYNKKINELIGELKQ